jgi:hypothetical protein
MVHDLTRSISEVGCPPGASRGAVKSLHRRREATRPLPFGHAEPGVPVLDLQGGPLLLLVVVGKFLKNVSKFKGKKKIILVN